MREFDFDELDRAVNSVLNKEPTGRQSEAVPERQLDLTDATGRPEISTHPVHSRLVPTQRGQHRQALRRRSDAVVPAQSPEQSEAASVQAPATTDTNEQEQPTQQAVIEQTSQPRRSVAPRQSGRFMDMVHPSSDMSTSTMKKKPMQPLKPVFETPASAGQQRSYSASEEKSIEAAQISDQPSEIEKVINDLLVDEVNDPQLNTDLASKKDAAVREVDERGVDDANQATDSLVQSQFTVADENSSPSVAGTAFEMPSPDDPNFISSSPQTSPFLTDAQVQKRPLGANRTQFTDASNTDDSKIDLSLQGQSDTQAERPSEADTLHTKIQAIESIEVDTPDQQTDRDETVFSDLSLGSEKAILSEMSTEESMGSTAAAPLANPDNRKPVHSLGSERKSVSSERAMTGPSSIARQYKETPAQTSEDDTNPIFDPENYRQPLEHQPKKKSGWGWVIATIVLILVGAAAVALLWQSGLLVVPL